MKRKIMGYSLIVFLLVGICLSYWCSRKIPVLQNQPIPVVQTEEIIVPAIIDASNDMTRVPSIQTGIVKKMNVTVGQAVKKGEALFSLDDTVGKHNVVVNRIEVKQVENNISIQNKNLKHAQAQLKRLKSIDKRAINQADLREKTHEVKMAMMQLKLLKHNLAATKTKLKNAELALKQFTVEAPKDGIVLQINAHVDEYIGGGSQVIILGDAQKVIVRISIDERDIKKFTPTASVFLTSPNHEQINIPLTFMQLDRYIIVNDRLSARVQEALYYFNRNDHPNLVAGEQFDAHITINKA